MEPPIMIMAAVLLLPLTDKVLIKPNQMIAAIKKAQRNCMIKYAGFFILLPPLQILFYSKGPQNAVCTTKINTI